jgi:hypothetical protein
MLLGTFHYPASPLDEGTLVSYPSRVLQGAIPHRDFVTFYGPANFWILAAAFKLFGASLGVERAVGLGFRLLALSSVFAIGARFGRVPAVAGTALAAVVWLPLTVQANAALAAIALMLCALALLSRTHHETARRATLLIIGAGAASGLATLMRFDFLPAVALSVAPLLVSVRRGRGAFLIGLLPMLALGVGHLVLIGPDAVERVLHDIVASGPGRDLPLPGLDTDAGRLFVASVLAAVVTSATGFVTMRREGDPQGALLAALGLLVAAHR